MAEQIVEEKKILRFVFVIRVIVPYERGLPIFRFFGPKKKSSPIYLGPKNLDTLVRFPGNTLTHSTNEDLLNIKRKGDPEVSYPLS
jgi:hypothetical protein